MREDIPVSTVEGLVCRQGRCKPGKAREGDAERTFQSRVPPEVDKDDMIGCSGA